MSQTAAITEIRFAALKAKLRELFELDKSDLDFGIYRIMAAKNAEVTEFLDRQLKDVVCETLAAHGAGAADQVQRELDQTIADLQRLNAPIDTNPKVIALRTHLDNAAGGAAIELEADIYNHLLAFFGRYYDEGDFISKRRYKGDVYAIPYAGEEVTLHWANKDQYYIKSGEWHKDYRFKVGGANSGGTGVSPVRTVRFKLVEATQEGGGGNNKEADDAKRRYIIDYDNPIEVTDSELTIRFQFRPPTEDEKARAADAVSIFGGDYAKPKNPKKGDEREQFAADAERRVLEVLTSRDREGAVWLKVITTPSRTESKPHRTILGKHLDHFTARNTFDYFIHKDLGGFLRRELDFYIKNEVVRLDDLETLPPDHLRKVQGRVKAIRRVAGRVIDLLASIEDFQKKMWLKKKLVLETNWLVTIDRIPGGPGNSQENGSGQATGASDISTERAGTSPARMRQSTAETGGSPAASGTSTAVMGTSPARSGTSPKRSGESPAHAGTAPHVAGNAPGDAGNASKEEIARLLRIGDLRQIVANNPRQWKQWEDLGFKPLTISPSLEEGGQGAGENALPPSLEGGGQGVGGRAEPQHRTATTLFTAPTPQWGTREYLDAHPNLVVDTALFDDIPGFKAALLASEEILGGGGKQSLDEATTGVLIHSENFQALNLLQERYREQINSIYIDPPYNTDAGPIIYKNGYKSSSWLALMLDRIAVSQHLMAYEACYALAIDDFEMARLAELCDEAFGGFDRQVIIVNHHPQGGMSHNVSRTHEYMLIMVPDGEDILRGKAKSGKIEYRSFALSGPGSNKSRIGRPNSFYALQIDEAHKKVVGAEPPPRLGQAYPTSSTPEGFARRYPIAADGSEKVWCRSYESALAEIVAGNVVVSESGTIKLAVDTKGKRSSLMSNWTDSRYNAGPHGTALIADILGGRDAFFSYPKSIHTVRDAIDAMTWMIRTPSILDYFAGSGTTGHAVINLNREDGGDRKFILVEMGAYFNTVLKPRIAKVIYSPDWKDGKAQSHDKPLPGGALVKYFALESYEDALNNLPAGRASNEDASKLFAGLDAAARDAWITYALDLELGPHLLNLDAFRDPWGFTINAQLAGEEEIKPHRVDLIETFNYLIGLKVKSYGPIERFDPEFERAEHELNGMGRLKVKPHPGAVGGLKKAEQGADAPFVFQRIEGELNDGANSRVLVVWRKLTDDPEKDAAVLDAWLERHHQQTTERTEHRDYHTIYVNGPVTLRQPTQEMRTVYPIEETFKAKMFEDADGNEGGGL